VIVLLQPLRWRCSECAIHHERNVCEAQHDIYVAGTSKNTVEWSCRVNSIVSCCYSAKLCAHAARAFRSQRCQIKD